MLTAEQLEKRTRGIGASEVPALFDESRFATELDVWATKRRGPDGSIPPIKPATPDPDKPGAGIPVGNLSPMISGSLLEDAIVRLLEHAKGFTTERCDTLAHPQFPRVLATPDRLIGTDEGVEAKLVGHWMAPEWADNRLPTYVWQQCQMGMAVTGRAAWHVAALLEGSSFRYHRVERDSEWIAGAVEYIEMWCVHHLDGDNPPEPRDAKDLARFNRRKWPEDNGKTIKLADAPELAASVDPLLRRLIKLKAAENSVKRLTAETKAKLEALCGEREAIISSLGRFKFKVGNGRADWKATAKHIAGGSLDDSQIIYGETKRSSQFYPFKRKTISK